MKPDIFEEGASATVASFMISLDTTDADKGARCDEHTDDTKETSLQTRRRTWLREHQQ